MSASASVDVRPHRRSAPARPRRRARSSGGALPLALQTHGAVWPATAPAVIAAAAWATLVYILSRLGPAPNFGAGSASLSGVLSMIVGLLVSYRCAGRSEVKLIQQLLVLERSLA